MRAVDSNVPVSYTHLDVYKRQAFDVAAATGCEVEPLHAAPVAAVTTAAMAVELNAGSSAPRFCCRVIEGVDASAATPLWMAQRLLRSGVRPISLLVDVTQYIMLELGQPMHAYDRDLLKGPLAVRHARAGETLKSVSYTHLDVYKRQIVCCCS